MRDARASLKPLGNIRGPVQSSGFPNVFLHYSRLTMLGAPLPHERSTSYSPPNTKLLKMARNSQTLRSHTSFQMHASSSQQPQTRTSPPASQNRCYPATIPCLSGVSRFLNDPSDGESSMAGILGKGQDGGGQMGGPRNGNDGI